MTPRTSNKPFYKLTIPELSGGVNYRDGISQVLDNQLTDCNNVWYKNGILRTRPGVKCAEGLDFINEYYGNDSDVTVYTKKENFRVIDGETYFLVAIQTKDCIRFVYHPENSKLGRIEVATIGPNELPQGEFTCNIFQHDADIYCFCSGYYEKPENADPNAEWKPYYIFKISEDTEKKFDVKRITDETPEDEGGFYVPVVMTNCGPATSAVETAEGMMLNGASMLEGYNLLCPKYKMVFSTANEGKTAEEAEAADEMKYSLLHDVKSFVGQKVVVTITDCEGSTKTHEVAIKSGDKNVETENQGDGMFLAVQGKSFWFITLDGGIAKISRNKFVRNNMVVTAPCPCHKTDYEKVLNMTFSEWFGGGSEGIYDGIHLFMGGNTAEKEKALVCWSDFDKPLYFSENGYAYVGDKAQRVTAFGKQGESLIILKERETYATQYSSIDSVMDAEAVINQSIVDVTASEVTFPMVQVHGFIGCDCPKTVQLCRNRLVWAHSDGKLYTLVSANQWNERSIFEVSAMVERQLKSYSADALKKALSADWEGHYVLSLGDKFYLMDYNSYGYANVTSYSKSEDAQLHIPWWVWDKPLYPHNTNIEGVGFKTEDKPINVVSMVTAGQKLFLCTEALTSESSAEEMFDYRIPEIMCFEGEDDKVPDIRFEGETEPTQQRWRGILTCEIPAMAQTKLFDFGNPTTRKSVPKAEMSFGSNGGKPISVFIITDKGQTEDIVVPQGDSTDETEPKFFESVVIRNPAKLNNRIGYRLESSGNLFLDAISIHYKQLEGAK